MKVGLKLIYGIDMKTTLVNKKGKVKGTFYIGRGSRFGNPFSHLEGTKATYVVESREAAIVAYEDWVRNGQDEQAKFIRDSLWLIRGEVLECFCKPLACHGDVLIKLIKEMYGDE